MVNISIALVTRNRPEQLGECLESVRQQSCAPFEIVVSDDSDLSVAHHTRAVAERYGCRYIEGPRRGLYANRNSVALSCLGTHIRTMDDDHRFPPGHFEQCFEAVSRDPKAIWTTGEIGFVDGVFVDRVETANQLHPSGAGIAPANLDDNWTIADGSTIYPSSVFQDGHRMVEESGYGSSYLEFGAFLYRRGYRSRCVPGAVIEHYATPQIRERLRRYDEGQALSAIFAILAYNLYFERNIPRGGRYVLSVLARTKFKPKILRMLPSLARRVHLRWSVGRPIRLA